jgi:protein-tyrosine phosphatase
MIDHPKVPVFEYNYIDDGIFIGTNQCCQTHFDEQLLKEGIEADISLEENRIDAPFGVTFYVWIPTKNHTPPKDDQLDFGVAVLEKLTGLGKKVYVHCQNGHGRAPTLVSAYFIKTKNMTPEEAEKFIKSKRPTIHLEDIQKEALIKYKNGL